MFLLKLYYLTYFLRNQLLLVRFEYFAVILADVSDLGHSKPGHNYRNSFSYSHPCMSLYKLKIHFERVQLIILNNVLLQLECPCAAEATSIKRSRVANAHNDPALLTVLDDFPLGNNTALTSLVHAEKDLFLAVDTGDVQYYVI